MNKQEKAIKIAEKEDKRDEESSKKKLSLKSKIGIVAAVLLLLFAVSFIALYLFPSFEKLARPIFKKVPFPIAIINNGEIIVFSSELIQSADAVKNFYESQDYAKFNKRVDFSTEDGKDRLKIKEKDVFDKLIENKVIEKVSNSKSIYITQEQAQQEIDRLIAEGGDKNSLELNLKSLYGWTLDDFRDNVVIYQMYTNFLLDWYTLNIESTESFKKIKKAKEELSKDGSNFADIAKKYSEGDSAENRGEVGWFKQDELVEEVAEAAFEMNKGDISDVIISPLGFHVFQAVEFEGEGTEESPKKVNLRQIFVRGLSFLDWLAHERKSIKVKILMKDYSWDEKNGGVIFRNEELRKMEKKMRLKADGDPSL